MESKTGSDEKRPVVDQAGATDYVWWAFGVSLLVVGTIAIYAFVIVAAML